MDKISEDRLFLNNTKEEIQRWSKHLQYFHYMRARGGHNCEGDSFCVYFKYTDFEDLTTKLSKLNITLNQLTEDQLSFDPFASYSIEDLDKIRITIPNFSRFEQPQYVKIWEYKAHIWVMPDRFEISISGTKDNKMYKVSEQDFEICLLLEKEFSNLGWKSILDEEIKEQAHCISKEKYPELF
ncbi:hypothetical protein [Dysgonomonas sp. Marseille-P4677]|uniref:hypothetical protein n=1 Tax=Dysgonomonas sp. Marseille-P4677 TaxID=2364790 RepID=UPI001F270D6A|nr:hypothetical protein [Dysgonomonas sp. Marseille-P4677]